MCSRHERDPCRPLLCAFAGRWVRVRRGCMRGSALRVRVRKRATESNRHLCEGGGEGGGRFHIEPVSRFWKGGRAFQQLSASRRGVWRSRYVDMRDSRGAIIYLVFSCSFSSYIFQASKNLCPYPSSPIHVFPFLLFPFLTGDRLSHKCE